MPSPPTAALTIAVALWSAATTATAYTCSQAEDSRIYQLFQAVKTDPLCSRYVVGNTIKWTCDKTPDCTQLVQQLAEELPDCFSAKDATNFRSTLNSGLYTTCKLCTLDQLRKFSALAKQVSQSSACSPYSNGNSGFTWPCTATSCTAMVKSVSKDVPSCNYAGDNLKAQVLNDIEACTGTSVSTTKPPSGNPSTPSSTSSSTTSKACTTSEKTTARQLLDAAANSSSCASADKYIYSTSVQITTKCQSTCFEQSVRPLARTLPDCWTGSSISSSTAREAIQEEVDKCDGDTTKSRTAYISVFFSSSSSVSGKSAAAPLERPMWAVLGALVLAIALTFPQLLRG